jgi:hypothetical protein
MKGIYKKLTYEDKFARKYYCNSYRFLSDMKRQNRRKLRRLLRVKRDEVILMESEGTK